MKYRRIFNTIVIILTYVLIACTAPVSLIAADNTVSIGLTTTQVPEGSDFTAQVTIDNITNFDVAKYDVTYNPAVIKVTDVTDGSINGTTVPVAMWASIQNTTIRVINNIDGVVGVSGSGYLAEIHFEVVGSAGASSDISLHDGQIGDNNAQGIVATWTGGAVQVIATSSPSQDSNGGGGGGGGGSTEGLIILTLSMTMEGRLTEDVTGMSGDKKVELFLPKNTVVKNRLGSLVYNMRIEVVKEPPAPPGDSKYIGFVYNIKPEGVTFEPPITVRFYYDISEFPQGISENNLFLAMWDKSAKEWVKLESTVDPDNGFITAKLSHLSNYALIAGTRPAAFVLEDISINPLEVKTGENAIITVKLANTGDLKGSHEILLMVNNFIAETRTVTLEGGESQEIGFTCSPKEAGSYNIEIGSLTGTLMAIPPMTTPEPELQSLPAIFTVSDLLITPNRVNTFEEVRISAVVTNTGGSQGSYTAVLRINSIEETKKEITLQAGASERIYFTQAKDVAGSYKVNIGREVGKFDVVAQPNLPEPITPVEALPENQSSPWPLVGAIIGSGIIVIGLFGFLFIFIKRRRSK